MHLLCLSRLSIHTDYKTHMYNEVSGKEYQNFKYLQLNGDAHAFKVFYLSTA